MRPSSLSPEPFTPEVVDPGALGAVERQRLGDELFRLHQRLFAGAGRERFEQLVIRPPARWTRIQVLRNSVGEAVGY